MMILTLMISSAGNPYTYDIQHQLYQSMITLFSKHFDYKMALSLEWKWHIILGGFFKWDDMPY